MSFFVGLLARVLHDSFWPEYKICKLTILSKKVKAAAS